MVRIANIWAGDITPVGDGEHVLARDVGRPAGATEAAELSLREGAEDRHALCESCGDGRGRVGDCAGGAATTTRPPLHVRQAQLGEPERGRQSRRLVAVVRVGREPVDVSDGDSRVLACREHGSARELELRFRALVALVVGRLAHARHGDSAAQPPLLCRPDDPILAATDATVC